MHVDYVSMPDLLALGCIRSFLYRFGQSGFTGEVGIGACLFNTKAILVLEWL